MPPVRDLGSAARRFEQRASAAVPEFQQGVQANDSWETATAAAREAWEAGVRRAQQQDRFTRGVRRAGQNRFRERTLAVGATRFAEGVAGAGQAWQEGFQPFADAIRRTQLPARGPRGSQQNINRMIENVRSIIAANERIKGGGGGS